MICPGLHYPHCQGTDIVRHDQTRQGKQRYRCREQRWAGRAFLLNDVYAGQSPDMKRQTVDMAMNASGIRETVRVFHFTPNIVINSHEPFVSLPRSHLSNHTCSNSTSACS